MAGTSQTWRRLQPLRVASGWMIDVNSLYAVDPAADTIDWLYGSVLVSGHLERTGLCFDVRWEPEGDPEGCYVVDFLRLARRAGGADRDVFIGTWTTSSRSALVETLEVFMFTRIPPAGLSGPGESA